MLTITSRVRGPMAASIAARSRSNAGPAQGDLARHGIGREQHRLVAEPGRLGEDGLVAGIEQEPEGHRDGAERTAGQRDVGRLEGQAQLPTDGSARNACGSGSLVL